MTLPARPRWLLPLLFLLSAGCATQPPQTAQPVPDNWPAHRAAIESLHEWQVQGRIALRSADEGWSASFDWQQRGDAYRIRLRGPFGQGAVELHGSAAGVWLQRAERAPVFAQNAETLLEQETGWRLPVSGLGAWLRGVPVAEGMPPDAAWDAQGRLRHLAQNGWQIDYQRYLEQDRLSLPQKLRLQRDSLRVKLVIDGWRIP